MEDFITTEYNEKLIEIEQAQFQFTGSFGVMEQELAPAPTPPFSTPGVMQTPVVPNVNAESTININSGVTININSGGGGY